MRIKITADSTCDLPRSVLSKYGIGIIPLSIIMDGGKPLRDGIEVTPDEVFEFVESGKGQCVSTAVNIAEYASEFRACLEEADAVVHVNLSSEMSMCHQNAVLAANAVSNVYVVDSRNLSTGTGYLAIEAAIMAQSGTAPDEIKQRLDELALRMEVSFVIDTLAYMRKGGRCSAVQALGANLLGLKPCIQVIDGKMDVGKKYRGKLQSCLAQYVENRLADRDDIDTRRLFVTHSRMEPALVEAVMEEVKKILPFDEIIETDAGCVVSAHCGPNTLGLLYARKPR